MKEDIKKLFIELCSIPERQLSGETDARNLIESYLQSKQTAFTVDEYETCIPKYLDWGLKVDGKKIECLPCGYVSGKVVSKATVLASTISSQKNVYDANINFNPYSNRISRSNFYFAPALAIHRSDVQAVLEGGEIDGYMNVEKTAHTSANILVGNAENPKNIIFTHFDSVGTGAIDNASGTALTLELLSQYPELLAENLFAICGNEELSYDETIYWGHGYREFEDTYPELLTRAKHIYILDSFGHTPVQQIKDVPTMTLAFPVAKINELASKMTVIAGDLGALMQYYHAEDDVILNLKDEYYQEAYDLTLSLLKATS